MKNMPEHIIFRKSHVVLIMRLVLLEVILVALYLLVRIPKSTILPSFIDLSGNELVNMIGVLYFIVISIIELIFVLQIALDWSNEVYEIREDSLVHKRGILNLRQETYTLRNLGSANIYQGFFGKVFNFGTIVISSPILKQDIVLLDIHNPQQILASLEDNIEQSNVDEGNIIRRR